MTVLPFGRSGTIAAAMLGLGRALGETVAVLIILRTASTPSHVQSLRRRLHLRLEDRLRGRGVQRPTPDGCLHRRRFRAVRPHLHRQRDRPRHRRQEGARHEHHRRNRHRHRQDARPEGTRHTDLHPDQPGAPGQRPRSRRSSSPCASRSRSCHCCGCSSSDHQGCRRGGVRDMVDQIAAGDPARAVRRRGLPRHLRHARPGVHRRDHRRAPRD